MTTKFKHIGSVSHGTMRAEDLIPRFAGLLEELHADAHHGTAHGFDAHTIGLIKECEQWSAQLNETGETEQEIDDDLLSSLFDSLNDYAPPYFYFGAHEGDGSDYGFWLSQDALECAQNGDELLRVEDTADVPDDYSGEVLLVNDHGNCTLYAADNGELTEIWSIV